MTEGQFGTSLRRREKMSPPSAYYCFENQSLDEAREIMREHHLEYLPVVDDNLQVIGRWR